MLPIMQQFLNVVSSIQSIPPEHTKGYYSHLQTLYKQMPDDQTLSLALCKLAEHIMRLRSINEAILDMVEQCVYDIILKSVEKEFKVGSEALRCIFDFSSEYYKHNRLDPSLKNPLGLGRPLNWYQPQVGEAVDVVKPYITSSSYSGWTRGILLSRENKKYTVKYDNTDAPVSQASLPFFDKLGSRTPDYEWRNNLQIGSQLDALNKFWYLSTVVEVGVDNGAKRVRVSFRKFHENGQKVDSDGYRYDGLGPNQDDWIDITSPRIQVPGKMARELCYYSQTSEEIPLDDTYDLIFEKEFAERPFWGLMRTNVTRSLSYLHFFNYFCDVGGVQLFMKLLQDKEINFDSFINMTIVFGCTSSLIPQMNAKNLLQPLLEAVNQYIIANHKLLNGPRLESYSYFVENVSKRYMSLSQKHALYNNLRKFLSIQFLKYNLEKQMLALKFLIELIKPVRPYQNDLEREELHQFLSQNQIFYKIIQNNVHEQILSRSVELLRYMLDNKIIGWNEIDYIWNIIPQSDLRGRAIIEKLISDISKDFSLEYSSRIIDKLLSVKETDITTDKLNLLRTLKDKPLTTEYKIKILNYLWECLTIKSTNIKQNIEEQIQNVFRGFISTIKESSLRLEVVKAILKRLKEITIVRNQMLLFKQFLLTYPAKLDIEEESSIPQTIFDVAAYLKSQSIYEIILKLLALAKNNEKIQSILDFTLFLFDKDMEDISFIVKSIYNILGPSDIFLLWAKNLTARALNFFIELYETTKNMQKFEKISVNGLQAIKAILLDINVYEENIKIIRKKKITVESVPIGPVNMNNVGTSTSDISSKPVSSDKEETLTFVYVLKSPFQCKGLAFLLQLLQYIKNDRVYADIIKLIIQFIVNLDDKIVHKAQMFMQEFLQRICNELSQISYANIFTTDVKLKVEIYINLIEELFAQTEINGLFGIKPHFSTIQGEYITLKIDNCIVGSNIHKKEPFTVVVNENITLWDFKIKLAEIYQERTSSIDVIKFVNPIQDSNNSKSLQALCFFNEEVIKVQRKTPKEIPRHELVTPDLQNLSDKFNKIVEKWFHSYQNKAGILTFDDMMKLGKQQWKGTIFKQPEKIEQIINKYDEEKKGGLTLSQFKAFFIKKSVETVNSIWRLINLSGYTNNLKHKDEKNEQPLITAFPRKILSKRPIYDLLFMMLANQTFQPLHQHLYKLLTMLETDHESCDFIKTHVRDFLQNQKCIYKLSYHLQALTKQLDNDMNLYALFNDQNGHIETARKLNNYFLQQKSIYTFDTISKTVVIPNLIKILNMYIYPQLSNHKSVRFIKKNKINLIDIEAFNKKIEQEDSYAEEAIPKKNIIFKINKLFNIEDLFALAHKIFQNEINYYQSDYLIRVTYQISRLFGSLAMVSKSFSPQMILNGIKSDSINIRRACQCIIFLNLQENSPNSFVLLDRMVQDLPKDIKFPSVHYFNLACLVLERTIARQHSNLEKDEYFYQLALRLIDKIWETSSQVRGLGIVNRVLLGLLETLLIILQRKPKICRQLSYLKEQLIKKFLFFYNAAEKIVDVEISQELLENSSQPELFKDYIKCKSEDTRKVLMEIIYTLYLQCSQDRTYFFENFILPIINELPENIKKTSNKSLHVGLNNLGSTCYMNSMLQVLNSIDTFRNAIMMTTEDAPILKQLKSLFSFLFFSERVDYIPKDLLTAFVPPINPGIQQDTTEFLNFLFDQIEESLKKSPFKHLLEEIFKGNQVAQMICHSCGAKRERQETFFTYSVEIEGKYDLHTALEGMHTGQLISDCLCESCGKRSDTTKRNVLNEVPNIFFVHLKRIVFNYDVFINTKIHTRLYFPDELNFEPYTKEGVQLRESLGVQYIKSLKDNEEEMKKFEEMTLHGKEKKYYQLKLKGIIIHSGTPDVGHYYAIVKKGDRWVKLDDSRTTVFLPNGFEEQCYGGNWTADQWGGFGSSKNAYVLIYEKEYKKNIIIEDILDDQTVLKKVIPYQDFKTFNTVEWYKKVWLDNHSLMLEQHMIGETYTKDFLHFTCKMLQITPSVAIIDIIAQIFYKVSGPSGEVGNLLQIFNKHIHLINVIIFEKYVIADKKKTFDLLFHNQFKVREFASMFLFRVLIHCFQKEGQQTKHKVINLIHEYLQMLHGQVAKNWLRIDCYFGLFDCLVNASFQIPQLYYIFSRVDFISYFIDFILQKASPLNICIKKYSIGTKSNPVSFHSGLNIVHNLLRRSYGIFGINYEQNLYPPEQLFHLSDNSITCITSPVFYEKMIKENQNPQVLSSLIQIVCYKNVKFSQSIARILLKAFNENTELSDELTTIMLCIKKVLVITDEYSLLRAEAILGVSMPFIYQKNLLTSIDEQKYTYPSTLQNIFPLESLLSYTHINRIRIPITVLNMIDTILEICTSTDQLIQFILRQPSPSYIYLRYVDWLRPYINEVINVLSVTDKKREELIIKINRCNVFLDILDKAKQDMFVLISGEIGEKILIDSIPDAEQQVILNIYNVPVYGVESLPSGHGNASFDKYLTNGRLETAVHKDSNILHYFKQNSKPLAIVASPMDVEDAELTKLFDVNTNSKKMEEKKDDTIDIQKPIPLPKEEANAIEIQLPLVNIERANVYTDYLRCLEIVNYTEFNKYVSIQFFSTQNQPLNATVPSLLRFLLSKNKEEFWYTKINPYENWNQLKCYTITVEDYVDPSKRAIQRAYANPFEGMHPVQQASIEEKPVEPKPAPAPVAQKQNKEQSNNMNDFNEAEINCPICTYFNPISNSNCELCQADLHSR